MSTNGFSQKPRVEFIDYAKALSMVIVLCLHNGVFSGITFIFFFANVLYSKRNAF